MTATKLEVLRRWIEQHRTRPVLRIRLVCRARPSTDWPMARPAVQMSGEKKI